MPTQGIRRRIDSQIEFGLSLDAVEVLAIETCVRLKPFSQIFPTECRRTVACYIDTFDFGDEIHQECDPFGNPFVFG
jgi:hypothetical protein